jgi:hypothetical protein
MNSIVWDNADWFSGWGQGAQVYAPGFAPVVNYSCIQGWDGSLGGLGNTGGDPRFYDTDGLDNIPGTEDDDLRIRAGSSAIDAGDNDALPPDEFDLDGDGNTSERLPIDVRGGLRRVNDPMVTPDPGHGNPPIVDMGAYEYQEDCNENGLIDSLDIFLAISEDCNENGVPDECDLAEGLSQDCNSNGLPDECDVASGVSADCNVNWIPDDCDIAGGFSQDCNLNTVPDECDVSNGTSTDLNSNGIPDECDGLGDLNCDGRLNFDDINPFVLALSDPGAYQSAYPDCDIVRADLNGDWLVDFDDINWFVFLLTR